MFTNLEEMQKFSKEQFEASSAAAASLTKGLQELAVEATEYSKKSLEESTAMFEKLLGARTLDSAFQIQSDYAKSTYEGWVAKSARFGELFAGLAKEAFRPVETAFAKTTAAVR
jgi:phasin family protein